MGSSASATTTLQLGVTLNSNEPVFALNTNNTFAQNIDSVLATPTTADFVTDARFYDAQGGARDISVAFVKRGTNFWDWIAYTDGANIVGGTAGTNSLIGQGTLEFNPNGSLENVTGNGFTVDWSGGVPSSSVTLDFGDQTGGFAFATPTGDLAFQGVRNQATTIVNTSAITVPSNAPVGVYTLTGLTGPNRLTLTLPDGTTSVTVADPGASATANFNFGAYTIAVTTNGAYTHPGAGAAGNITVTNTGRGNVQAITLNQAKYDTVHPGSSPVGTFTFGWNNTTSQLTVTDPFGATYGVSVPTTAIPRTVEFANGVIMDLGAGWVAPTSTVTLGTVALSQVNPGGTGVGTDGLLQLSSNYATRFSIQNGFGSGTLSAVNVDEEGYVIGSFTNGQSNKLYRLVVGVFQNPSGLAPVSENLFQQTEASGLPLYREAGLAGSATVSSGALEQSTVDIANEFSQLIISQRAYQAASRVVSTVDQMLNELLNLR